MVAQSRYSPLGAMFTREERERIRSELIAAARADDRIIGCAITGSASTGNEDMWSDIDLAFGVREGVDITEPLEDFSGRMYREYGAMDDMDVLSGSWIYRVFLLKSTLQVDLAFAPEREFGARAPTFKLLFGTAVERPFAGPPEAKELVGYAWLYALHVRSCIERGKVWQAEHMISGMRERVLMLACLRHGMTKLAEGRSMDLLPKEVTAPLESALVRSFDIAELRRAFAALTKCFVQEMKASNVDAELIARLEPILNELTQS